VPSRLVDAGSELRSVLDDVVLGRHETENDAAVGRDVTQCRKRTSPRRVVLQRESVDVSRTREHAARDSLVAAFGQPSVVVVAAAQVHGELHAGQVSTTVDQLNTLGKHAIGVDAEVGEVRRLGRIGESDQVGGVELNVAAAERGQLLCLGSDDVRRVGEECERSR
jgi:hypothetical protein